MITQIALVTTIVAFVMSVAIIIKVTFFTTNHEDVFKWRMLFWLGILATGLAGLLTILFYFIKI